MHKIGKCRSCPDGRTHQYAGDTIAFFEIDFVWKVLKEEALVMDDLAYGARWRRVTLLR